ncbi:hypothetical protein DL98DRAFT_289913 [Cadophora sp. DSE1049]|nr:hypothetical protein DL98DRAFT_289913 [Cadophora sp. DSE1049]
MAGKVIIFLAYSFIFSPPISSLSSSHFPFHFTKYSLHFILVCLLAAGTIRIIGLPCPLTSSSIVTPSLTPSLVISSLSPLHKRKKRQLCIRSGRSKNACFQPTRLSLIHSFIQSSIDPSLEGDENEQNVMDMSEL